MTKKEIDKLVGRAVGQDKVQTIAIQKQENGKKYRWYYEEPGIEEKQWIDFPTYDAALLYHFHFGGKNLRTVAAHIEYGDFLKINTKDLKQHQITQITISYEKLVDHNISKHFLNDKYGYPILQSHKQKNGKSKNTPSFIETTKAVSKATVSRRFDTSEQFHALQNFMAQHFQGFSFHVQKLVTLNRSTGQSCVWKRESVGDGSKRMVLKLQTVDDKPYQEMFFMDLCNVADEMMGSECNTLKERYLKHQISCVDKLYDDAKKEAGKTRKAQAHRG